jgi:AcrR family transcriptional regulator
MPKIAANSIAEHRAMRRDALVDAATNLMRQHGTVNMAAVAKEVGVSRSAVYEYYASSADLIADVLVDELAAWVDHLDGAVSAHDDPAEQVRAWIIAVLSYVADGRHALVRAAGKVPLPPVRRAQVQAMHRGLAGPLVNALGDDASARQRAAYVWGVVETCINAIESGADVHEQADLAWCFCQAGLSTSLNVN